MSLNTSVNAVTGEVILYFLINFRIKQAERQLSTSTVEERVVVAKWFLSFLVLWAAPSEMLLAMKNAALSIRAIRLYFSSGGGTLQQR